MRRRAVQLAVTAVTVALLLIGLPLAFLGAKLIWDAEQSQLDIRAEALARAVERRFILGYAVDQEMLEPWVSAPGSPDARVIVYLPLGTQVETAAIDESAALDDGAVIRSMRVAANQPGKAGAIVIMEVPVREIQVQIASMIALVAAATGVAFVVAVLVAMRGSRRIAAPLLYLAAAAEQLGSGQVRPNVTHSGIEEIDLVQDELLRTADRMAGRIAAERQFAADASHQLRTPLTSLSMRLEEIQFLSEDPDVQREADLALQQVERLGGVVDDLMRSSRRAQGGTTAAVRLTDIFEMQLREWGDSFRRTGRKLSASDEAGRIALASPGALTQALATLLENSLKYGAGATTISTRPASGHGVFIDVADQGLGVASELPDIFAKGVSGSGSSGLGLALARDLITADGGRLELTQAAPPVFTIFLNGLPQALDPAIVLPTAMPVAPVRRRKRR